MKRFLRKQILAEKNHFSQTIFFGRNNLWPKKYLTEIL